MSLLNGQLFKQGQEERSGIQSGLERNQLILRTSEGKIVRASDGKVARVVEVKRR